MAVPMGCFLTWSCSDARLPGDRFGSVDDRHDTFGQEYAPAASAREQANCSAMTVQEVVLSAPARAVVETALGRHCDVRNWSIAALNVRSTHVHVVLVRCEHRPEIAVGQLKSWATRYLREAGLANDDRVWSREASTRYLWSGPDVDAAADYVLNMQGDVAQIGWREPGAWRAMMTGGDDAG